jgi:ferredoxin
MEVVEVDEQTPLLKALKEKGVYIKSSCGGCASCSDCIVKVRSGMDNLNPPKFEEIRLLGNVFHITKERLSCQVLVNGHAEIDISEHDQKEDQKTWLNKQSKATQNKVIRKTSQQAQKDRDDRYKKHQEEKKSKLENKQGGGKRPRTFKSNKEES